MSSQDIFQQNLLALIRTTLRNYLIIAMPTLNVFVKLLLIDDSVGNGDLYLK